MLTDIDPEANLLQSNPCQRLLYSVASVPIVFICLSGSSLSNAYAMSS